MGGGCWCRQRGRALEIDLLWRVHPVSLPLQQRGRRYRRFSDAAAAFHLAEDDSARSYRTDTNAISGSRRIPVVRADEAAEPHGQYRGSLLNEPPRARGTRPAVVGPTRIGSVVLAIPRPIAAPLQVGETVHVVEAEVIGLLQAARLAP